MQFWLHAALPAANDRGILHCIMLARSLTLCLAKKFWRGLSAIRFDADIAFAVEGESSSMTSRGHHLACQAFADTDTVERAVRQGRGCAECRAHSTSVGETTNLRL
jgi:hypothetical protein